MVGMGLLRCARTVAVPQKRPTGNGLRVSGVSFFVQCTPGGDRAAVHVRGTSGWNLRPPNASGLFLDQNNEDVPHR